MKVWDPKKDIWLCCVCGFEMRNSKAGDYVYYIAKQKASKNDQDRTVFIVNKIGFRFCDECWTATAGKEYSIENF